MALKGQQQTIAKLLARSAEIGVQESQKMIELVPEETVAVVEEQPSESTTSIERETIAPHIVPEVAATVVAGRAHED